MCLMGAYHYHPSQANVACVLIGHFITMSVKLLSVSDTLHALLFTPLTNLHYPAILVFQEVDRWTYLVILFHYCLFLIQHLSAYTLAIAGINMNLFISVFSQKAFSMLLLHLNFKSVFSTIAFCFFVLTLLYSNHHLIFILKVCMKSPNNQLPYY